MRTISSVKFFQILDSRGFPTIEVQITDNLNNKFNACAPSGASTGIREVIELRDKKEGYFSGKSVETLLDMEEKINSMLVNQSLENHSSI